MTRRASAVKGRVGAAVPIRLPVGSTRMSTMLTAKHMVITSIIRTRWRTNKSTIRNKTCKIRVDLASSGSASMVRTVVIVTRATVRNK